MINTLPLVCQCDWKGSVGEFCDDHREKCVSIMQLLQHSSSENNSAPNIFFNEIYTSYRFIFRALDNIFCLQLQLLGHSELKFLD